MALNGQRRDVLMRYEWKTWDVCVENYYDRVKMLGLRKNIIIDVRLRFKKTI